MAELANILVVSDLHFGEELLPGASIGRRRAVELASSAFREFLRYHTVRRRDGRPWRLVINGDFFDFMSVVIPGTRPKQYPAGTWHIPCALIVGRRSPSTDRLSRLAGRYVGNDDPCAIVRCQGNFPSVGEVLEPFATARTFAPAASRSASARSVRSHVKAFSVRPKWPYAAVFS